MKSKIIWRYVLSPPKTGTLVTIEMPAGAEPLSVGMAHGEANVWAEAPAIDAGVRTFEKHMFMVVPTGHPFKLPDLARFLGTFKVVEDMIDFVFHVYDLGEHAR